MKVETTIKYYEGYIPPRCRKTRYNERMEYVVGTIKEIKTSSLKYAFTDKQNHRIAFLYNGKLYEQVTENIGNTREYMPNEDVISNFLWWQKNSSRYYSRNKENNAYKWVFGDYSTYETREDVIKRLNKDLGQYIHTDMGLLFKRIDKPYFNICWFGIGGNHGGTGLLISYSKNPKRVISKSNGTCFSITDFESAYNKAVEIATNRGDNLSIPNFTCNIEIELPEIFE